MVDATLCASENLNDKLHFHSNISTDVTNRYGRQLIVLISEWFKAVGKNPNLGCLNNHKNCDIHCLDGQKVYDNISSTSVLVVGAGGLGSPALFYLAASGIGHIGVVDGDMVEVSNLHRQIIHSECTVGTNKAISAEMAIKRLNSTIFCKSYPFRLNSENAQELISKYDIILDCTDDISTKILMDKICFQMNKSYVTGAALRHEGQLLVFDRNSYNIDELKNAACYMCIAQTRGIEIKDMCSKFGILGPVTGILGSLQSMEVLKIASGLGRHIGLSPSRMVSYNAFDPLNPFKTRQLKSRDPNCPACGTGIEPRLYKDMPTDVDDIPFEKLILKFDNSVLIDVRSRPQYTFGHLKNSINWPTDEIIYYICKNDYNQFINELLNRSGINKIDKIYVICRRGVESRIVAGKMKKTYNISDFFFSVEGGLHKYVNSGSLNLPLL